MCVVKDIITQINHKFISGVVSFWPIKLDKKILVPFKTKTNRQLKIMLKEQD